MDKKITTEIQDGYLIVRVPLEKEPTRSSSGKTLLVATTHGNIVTEAKVKGQNVTLGLNAYIR